jgi:hypothetical protein
VNLRDKIHLDEKYINRVVGTSQIVGLVILIVLCIGAFGSWIPRDPLIGVKAAAVQQSVQQLEENQRLEDMVQTNREAILELKAMRLESRMTALESTEESIMKVLIGIFIGVGVMLVDTAHRVLSPSRK